MGENQIHIAAYHSTHRMPTGKDDTIRAPDRIIQVPCYCSPDIVVQPDYDYRMAVFRVSM